VLGYTLGSWLLVAFLVPTAILMLMPFVWMVSTSLKSAGAVFEYPPTFIPNPIRWDNYTPPVRGPAVRALLRQQPDGRRIGDVLGVATSALAAYAFARLRFPGRDALFLGYLGTLMIPAQVVIIPNFILLRGLGWIDTYQALILPRRSAPSAPSCCASTSSPSRRTRGRRRRRRREPLADLHAGDPAALGAGALGAGDLHVLVQLELVPVPAGGHQLGAHEHPHRRTQHAPGPVQHGLDAA
jgi:hypothetical protein